MTSRVFAKGAGVLVCGVLLVSGCGLVPRSQTPQEALGLPQAETPFAERVSIEEYLRSEEPVLAGFARALAEKGGRNDRGLCASACSLLLGLGSWSGAGVVVPQ